MAEYQISMTDDGDASIVDLDSLDEIIIARSEIPYVARDLLAIMGYRTDYSRAELIAGREYIEPTVRFAQVSA